MLGSVLEDATQNDPPRRDAAPALTTLSAYEPFYQEKRPFFFGGTGAFDFGNFSCFFCSNTSSLDAFYSRRIGRPPQLNGYVSGLADFADTPDNTTILGAG